MSHVTAPAGFRYPWYMRVIFWRQRRRYGHKLEPVRLWGRIPGAFLAMSALYRALDRKRSRIEPSLRSLVQVLVSQINGCEFCDDLNSSTGVDRGIAPEKLLRLRSFEDSNLTCTASAKSGHCAMPRPSRGATAGSMRGSFPCCTVILTTRRSSNSPH